MSLLDIFDDLLGPLNVVDRLIGAVQIATRRGSRRRRQRYAAWDMVRVSIPRADKVKGAPTLHAVTAHMKRYGVDTYSYTHDSQCMYFLVARNQESWFRFLYNGGKLRQPTRAWKR